MQQNFSYVNQRSASRQAGWTFFSGKSEWTYRSLKTSVGPFFIFFKSRVYLKIAYVGRYESYQTSCIFTHSLAKQITMFSVITGYAANKGLRKATESEYFDLKPNEKSVFSIK